MVQFTCIGQQEINPASISTYVESYDDRGSRDPSHGENLNPVLQSADVHDGEISVNQKGRVLHNQGRSMLSQLAAVNATGKNEDEVVPNHNK